MRYSEILFSVNDLHQKNLTYEKLRAIMYVTNKKALCPDAG